MTGDLNIRVRFKIHQIDETRVNDSGNLLI